MRIYSRTQIKLQLKFLVVGNWNCGQKLTVTMNMTTIGLINSRRKLSALITSGSILFILNFIKIAMSWQAVS